MIYKRICSFNDPKIVFKKKVKRRYNFRNIQIKIEQNKKIQNFQNSTLPSKNVKYTINSNFEIMIDTVQKKRPLNSNSLNQNARAEKINIMQKTKIELKNEMMDKQKMFTII